MPLSFLLAVWYTGTADKHGNEEKSMENGCEKIRMVSTCLLGMEGPVAAELKSFEAEEVSAQDGRVFFAGRRCWQEPISAHGLESGF